MAQTVTATPFDRFGSRTIVKIEELGVIADDHVPNVRGKPTTLYSILITSVAVANTYIKLYNHDGVGISLGTTVPDVILPATLTVDTLYYIPNGLYFSNGLTLANSATNGTLFTAVGSDCDVYLLLS